MCLLCLLLHLNRAQFDHFRLHVKLLDLPWQACLLLRRLEILLEVNSSNHSVVHVVVVGFSCFLEGGLTGLHEPGIRDLDHFLLFLHDWSFLLRVEFDTLD